MQGVILAGGKGSRLQPITLKRSKAMVPILGKPIVERGMADLALTYLAIYLSVNMPPRIQ